MVGYLFLQLPVVAARWGERKKCVYRINCLLVLAHRWFTWMRVLQPPTSQLNRLCNRRWPMQRRRMTTARDAIFTPANEPASWPVNADGQHHHHAPVAPGLIIVISPEHQQHVINTYFMRMCGGSSECDDNVPRSWWWLFVFVCIMWLWLFFRCRYMVYQYGYSSFLLNLHNATREW